VNQQNSVSAGAKKSSMNGMHAGAVSIRSIFFATDFSPASHVAGLYARWLATQFVVPMSIAHVFLPSQYAQEAEAETKRPSADRIALTKELQATAAALSPRHAAATPLLCEGDPAVEIPRLVASMPGVLLVLGTHGGSSVIRHLIGSVAEKVLMSVTCPALTVGPHVADPHDETLFRHVLYATDCSEAGSRAAPIACAFACRFGGELKVISVVDEQEGATLEILAKFDFRTQHELSEAQQEKCNRFAESRTVAMASEAQKVILEVLTRDASDLLVLGVRQHAFLGFTERNSAAFQLIAKATRPVLTITDKSFL
jgi:nucleotide-binding universal stress UspA family protein